MPTLNRTTNLGTLNPFEAKALSHISELAKGLQPMQDDVIGKGAAATVEWDGQESVRFGVARVTDRGLYRTQVAAQWDGVYNDLQSFHANVEFIPSPDVWLPADHGVYFAGEHGDPRLLFNVWRAVRQIRSAQ